jgi:nucleoside-diphosphate-sugar epimerase
MRVVVIGATGNTGTSLLPELAREPAVDSVLGVARRLPGLDFPKADWAAADVETDDLEPLLRGADAVVHLAWAIQPSRDLEALRRTNVIGSERVFRAVAEAGVPALVYASSVGAYSPGPKDRGVDESWATGGIRSSFYSRHKAQVERLLDRFERERPGTRVVRMRPGLIFKREAASGVRRLFAGPFLVNPLVHPRFLPIVPNLPRLRFQALHSDDAGAAYRLAVVREDARGAFNLAAEPVLDPQELGRLLGARPVRVPTRLARGATALSWRAHLQPTPPGWLDLALGVPIMDVARVRTELGWEPRWRAGDALLDLLNGLRESAGLDTPPLSLDTGGPGRARELTTGVGERAVEP